MLHLLKKASPRLFLTRHERKILAEKTKRFEEQTGCEIIFHLRRKLGRDPVSFNRRLFHTHGLHHHGEKRGILVTLALGERKFAVWVDEGIEKHAGERLHKLLADSLSRDLKAGRHLEALTNVLDLASEILRSSGGAQ